MGSGPVENGVGCEYDQNSIDLVERKEWWRWLWRSCGYGVQYDQINIDLIKENGVGGGNVDQSTIDSIKENGGRGWGMTCSVIKITRIP